MELLIILGLLVVTAISGTLLEKRHLKNIEKREELFKNIVILSKIDLKHFDASGGGLLSSGVVYAIDYFRQFIFLFISFFGGRVVMYESVMDRARREAILRVKKQAQDYGFNCIVDLRVETATLTTNNKNQNGGKVEIIAYGTGINISK
ncbi:MAG: heavy metal-binding domain-containing protein [Candidatus Absconditabacteria bacterium]